MHNAPLSSVLSLADDIERFCINSLTERLVIKGITEAAAAAAGVLTVREALVEVRSRPTVLLNVFDSLSALVL